MKVSDLQLPISDNPRVYKDKMITLQNMYHKACEALVKASLDAETMEATVSYIRDKALLALKDSELTNPLKIAKSKVDVPIEVTLVEDGKKDKVSITYHQAKLLFAQKRSRQLKMQKLVKELESGIEVCKYYPMKMSG
jgi:hypothetical protein